MHIDYLRLSTYDVFARANIVSVMPPDSRKSSHWLNYAGFGGAHTFEGVGEQNGKRHYVAQTSGPLAHKWAAEVYQLNHFDIGDGIRCRRIDLAHDINVNWNPRELADELATEHKNITLMESSSGWTVYINKRRGEFMARIYHKIERRLTRCEFECKGQLAEQLWSYILADEIEFGCLVHLWRQLLKRANLPTHVHGPFDIPVTEAKTFIKMPIAYSNTEAKIQWMFGAFAGIEKMADDHETRDRVVDAVQILASAILHKYQD